MFFTNLLLVAFLGAAFLATFLDPAFLAGAAFLLMFFYAFAIFQIGCLLIIKFYIFVG